MKEVGQGRLDQIQRGEEMCEETELLFFFFPHPGTLGNNKSSFHMEMSQIGFSTHTMDVSPPAVTLFVCV